MKHLFNIGLATALIALFLVSTGTASAQNPTLVVFPNAHAISCDGLGQLGHIELPEEHYLFHSVNGVFPFGETRDFVVFGTPTSIMVDRSEAGNDTLVDWNVISGLQPVAIIMSATPGTAADWNAYIYDPTLPADTRLHNNGPNEADGQAVHFMKFCFNEAPPPPPPPGDGCTLTQGYWKNHSENGPAPYDATWNELPGADGIPNSGNDGSSTAFFTTGQTWYQIFHTNASGGNKYISLAHQWMAATLNGLADADLSEVATEMADGEALLAAHAANWNNPRGYSRAIRDQMNAIAGVLDDYNNGEIGPGHCDDSNFQSPISSLSSQSQHFARTPAYPNPFNPQSQFTLSVVEEQRVTAELYNTIGQRVATLFSGTVEVGREQLVTINAGDLPSGMYLVRISGERFTDSFSVTLLK